MSADELPLIGSGAAFLALLLLVKKPDGSLVANRLLAALMLVMGLIFVRIHLSLTGFFYHNPDFMGVSVPLSFLIGPLIYLYLKVLTEPNFQLHKIHLFHLTPALVCIIVFLPVFLSGSAAKQSAAGQYLSSTSFSELLPSTGTIHRINIIQVLSSILVLGTYALYSLRQVQTHLKGIVHNFSSTDGISLTWIRNLALLAVLKALADFAALILAPHGENLLATQIIPCMVILLICGYGSFHGIFQPAIHNPEQPSLFTPEKHLPDRNEVEKKEEKYEKSGLSKEGSALYWQELQAYMQTQKPHLITGLTIGQLAKKLDWPSSYLSQTINSHYGGNFFDYINQARIQAACSILDEGDFEAGSLSTLYLRVGFNSVSSFYNQFKKHSGDMTPSQYLKNRKENSLTEA
ncbi:helix-turn-helix domain-containing protein [Endozoicomonas arenosclerae]|uniref:helix-turn-helix domain-containing protein n=1 Tax=Endozoicomonas arenosclerae TaxID=1633495 RepID=UPI00078247A0|nr:AraC family transcriptional regulator [Endozoicomonas arenosclerae]